MINLNEVLLINDDRVTTLGKPALENAHIVASIVKQSRSKKIQVFKYKSKVRYRKLRGHRQHHTDLRVEEIVGPNGASWSHEKKDPPARDEPTKIVEDDSEVSDDETTVELSSNGGAENEAGTDGTIDSTEEGAVGAARDEGPDDHGEAEDN